MMTMIAIPTASLLVVFVLIPSTQSQVNYYTADFRNGSCSFNKFMDCDEVALCTQNPEHTRYRCYCPSGVPGDGYKKDKGGTGCNLGRAQCRETKECNQYAVCKTTSTSLGTCVCNSGFTGDGAIVGGCTDIDECLGNPCDSHADCSNSPGSFKCTCRLRDNYDGNGFTCTWRCFLNNDCHSLATCQKDSTCKCNKGYSGDGRTCTDDDECALNNTLCGANSMCVNLPGSYRCDCISGYILNSTNQCSPLPRNCDERLKIDKKMVNGYYIIDVDFTGPAKPVEVYCDVRTGFAITEIRPRLTFPAAMPKTAGQIVIEYSTTPENIKLLTDNSTFCSQLLWMQCTDKFNGGIVQWLGGDGVTRRSWGGAIDDGMCPCGMMGQCTGCKCGKGIAGVDDGYIINKNVLPVNKVIFPDSSGIPGSYLLGPVRCAPRTFDIPKDCHEAKFVYKVRINDAMWIDPDGDGPKPTFMVFCDVERFQHVGITKIPVTNPRITSTTRDGTLVKYLATGANMEDLIGGSIFCSMRVEYQCQTTTMTAAGVSVVSKNGSLSYFNGGINQEGSCACGLTKSCANRDVKCNCEVGDNKPRKDIELIINKRDLPVLKVTTTSADGVFILGPLECSQKQFGIEPNCEKVRLSGVTETHSYYIDPDGPSGPLGPFLVQCEINNVSATTVVNNNQATSVDLLSGNVYRFGYLQASVNQLEGLKSRSTYCSQTVTVRCSGSVNEGQIQYTGGAYNVQATLASILSTCVGSSCKCTSGGSSDSGTLTSLTSLPIYSVSPSSTALSGSAKGTLELGPLRCAEIFTDCLAYADFMRLAGVEGEIKMVRDTLNVDPDGALGVEPFTVQCSTNDTVIDRPTPNIKLVKVLAGRPGVTQCFNLTYTDMAGKNLSSAQLAAMMARSKTCRQSLEITCSSAPVTGKVYYFTCDNRRMDTLIGSGSNSTCSCGVGAVCSGGPSAQCNCDSSTVQEQEDDNLILENSRLPVCSICMELDPIPASDSARIPYRSIRFDVSQLRCGRKAGRRGNCQMFRQEADFMNITNPTFKDMWFDSLGQPFVVGCRFDAYPPTGQLVIRPSNSTYDIPDDGPLNVTVIYRGVSISVLRESMNDANYCTQKIFLFCASQVPRLSAPYGFYSNGTRVEDQTRDLTNDEKTSICSSDQRFSALCKKCGPPLGLMVIDKSFLPVTQLVMPPNSGVSVGVDDVSCAYVEKDCDAILTNNNSLSLLTENNTYVIDPDQAGPTSSFVASCEFIDGQGVTKIQVNNNWKNGSVGGSGSNKPVSFNFTNPYPTATPEQINSLTKRSAFCWQGVKYVCKEAALLNSNINPESFLTFYNGQTSNFGTASNASAIGCACGVLGTCITEDYTCNCDARKVMAFDQGFVTDRNALPVTDFTNRYTSPNAQGSLTLTDVRCAPTPIDIPRDCAETVQWGTRNGITYGQNGEFLINPDPNKTPPFLAYCDYTSSPGTGITRLRPRFRSRQPITDTNSIDITYYGVTDVQLDAILSISAFCYQPVLFDCFQTSLLEGGMTYNGIRNIAMTSWNSGLSNTSTCTCGAEQLCGGSQSREQQENTKCNCDLGDAVWRKDAAILNMKDGLPLRRLIRQTIRRGELQLTVGDLHCAQQPIMFDECALGYHDCAPEATCLNLDQGYKCICPAGWQGKTANKPVDAPVANGRQCIDDNECTQNLCPYNSNCQNTPGSYKCHCHQGYRSEGPQVCKDINECEEGTHNCDVNAKCVNNDGGFRCFCLEGYRGNGTTGFCSPIGKCVCFGDPHCLSFDGKWNHYQGLCSYTMAQSNCKGSSGLPNFRIVNKNWDREHIGHGAFAWVKEVTVEVYGYKIVMKQDNILEINGEEKRMLRVLNDDRETVKLSVALVGFKLELYTDFGLEISSDGKDEVQIVTPNSFKNHMCGMCGNYNDDSEDDWIVGPACPSMEGKLTTRESLFGTSWTVDTDECEIDCSTQEPPSTCDYSLASVNEMCSKLLTGADSPFLECTKAMDKNRVEGLKFSCQYDVCRTGNASLTMCETAEAVAGFCQNILVGKVIEWRSAALCGAPSCGANEEFKTCGSYDEPTCTPQPVQTVPDDKCREGCFCKQGFVRLDAVCVNASSCSCSFMGGSIKIGESRLKDDCTKSVTCIAHDTFNETDHSCNANEVCFLLGSELTCICKEGYHRNATTEECISVCAQHEVFKKCGSTTEPSCDDQNPVSDPTCAEGCFCQDGFVRQGKQCLPVTECGCRYMDKTLKIGSFVLSSDCTKTITCVSQENVQETENVCSENEDMVCSFEEGTFSCECQEGFERQTVTGQCLPKQPTCDESEEFKECGPSTEPSCDNQEPVTDTQCQSGCFCKEGLVREGDQCLPKSQCGCTNMGNLMQIGSSVLEDDCTKLVTCVSHENIKEVDNSCGKNEACYTEGGIMGCGCREGFTRDSNTGTCVPTKKEPPTCDEDREYKECGPTTEPSCDNQDPLTDAQCQSGCFCKDGLVRQGDQCLPVSECGCTYLDNRMQIGSSLVVDDCTKTVTCASHENLQEVDKSCSENEVCDTEGETMECVCQEGFMRDSNTGTCVPRETEPPSCDENTEYRQCGPTTEPSCDNQEPVTDTPCQSGCFCKDGLVRQGDQCMSKSECGCTYQDNHMQIGSAILADDCSKVVMCVSHENLWEDANSCGENEICYTEDGKMGCACKEAFMRDNITGMCVPIATPPPTPPPPPPSCDENTEYKACGPTTEPTCDNQEPVTDTECQSGCFCKDGLVRQGDQCLPKSECGCTYQDNLMQIGSSILAEDCTKTVKCVSHENLQEEDNSCGENEVCSTEDEEMGCACQEGFMRDSNTGTCVPRTTAPPPCDENTEYRQCGPATEPSCDNQEPVTDNQCHSGCFCKYGLVREGDQCLPVSACGCTYLDTLMQIGSVALADDCTKVVECLSHENLQKSDYSCEDNEVCNTVDETMECACQEGFMRDSSTGECVPRTPCDENTEYKECGPTTEPSCDNQEPVTDTECQSGCFCKEGLVREGDQCMPVSECGCTYEDNHMQIGSTLLVDDCTKTVTCASHDNLQEDDNSCGENEVCYTEGETMACACEEGFMRDSNTGTCVPRETEPPSCDENTEYKQCGPTTEPSCDNQEPVTDTECQSGCFCKEGLVREGDQCLPVSECGCTYEDNHLQIGSSRLVDDCSKTITCVSHENLQEADNSCVENEVCYTEDETMECVCQEGFMRESNTGTCVPLETEPPSCDENTEYRQCGPNTEPSCDNQEPVTDTQCQSGCFCKDGFVREGDQCLPVSDCGCTYQDNHMQIGSSVLVEDCTKTVTCVSHENIQEVDNSCGENEACYTENGKMGCACEDGFMRDSNTGTCVPRETEPPSCDENTEYRQCGPTTEPSCDNQEPVTDTQCQSGCFCKDGFVREGDQCLPVSDCGCTYQDNHMQIGSSVLVEDCTKTVTCVSHENIQEVDNSCGVNEACYTEDGKMGCACEEGFMRDSNTGACVPLETEPPSCDENTEYRQCGPNTEPSCDNQEPVTDTQCQSGCFCKDGFVREGDQCLPVSDCGCTYQDNHMQIGSSVLVEDCTKTVTCVSHENIQEVDNSCGENEACYTENGKMGCACEDGFMRDSNTGTCVPRETEPPSCDENTEYRQCGPTTEPSCDNQEPVTDTQCQSGCFCKDGFVREGDQCLPVSDCGCTYQDNHMQIGSSVLVEDCTKTVTCVSHENIQEVDNSCGVNEACYTEDGKMGCACEEGFMRDSNTGTCVSRTIEPPSCDENAEYRQCGPTTEPSCGNQEPVTDTQCNSGCFCKDGFVREGDQCLPVSECGCTYLDNHMQIGSSLLVDDCTKTVTCASHENLQEADNSCGENEVCGTDGETMGCVCQEGSMRDSSTGTCVPSVTCLGVECNEPNTECKNGICQCLSGYTANCDGVCEDIDECATVEHKCTHMGQLCVNLPGSYRCDCHEGFTESGGYCHDINECELPETCCVHHSECRNLLGTYECVCCMGYSKNGEACQRDERLDAVYGAPGEECCACTGTACTDPDPVCATDGNTYANYAAMVVSACRKNITLEVDYKGYCEESCANVVCEKPYQECVQTGPNGAAVCSCPDCSGVYSERHVCGSNKRIYASACIFKLIMCVTGRTDVTYDFSLEACADDSLNQWSDWSECSATCGAGVTYRTRSKDGTNSERQEADCYTTCDEGPCNSVTCHNPGQVCKEENGVAECVCPECTGRPEEPVCGLVGNISRTFDNECSMQRYACELTKNYILLENRACEEEPSDCGRLRNLAVLRDDNGCETLGDVDIGFCYGSCGGNPAFCCRPNQSASTTVALIYQCPNRSDDYTKEVNVINDCSCIIEPQH